MRTKDPKVCAQASTDGRRVCALAVAEGLEDFTPILTYISPGAERDEILALYSTTTLDIEAWDHIENPQMRDGAVISHITPTYFALTKRPSKHTATS